MNLSDIRIRDKRKIRSDCAKIIWHSGRKSKFSNIIRQRLYIGSLLFSSQCLFSVLVPKASKAIS